MFLSELSKENQANYFKVAYALVNADGKITEEEINTLNLYKSEVPDMKDISEYKVHDVSEQLKELALLDRKMKKKIYFEFISLAYTDDEISEEEKNIISDIASIFEISDIECKELNILAESMTKLLNKLGVLINE